MDLRRKDLAAHRRRRGERGFSVIELTVVFGIIIILTVMAVFAIGRHRATYRTDDTALRIISFMRDASQRALTQRQVIRLEIDTVSNVIRLRDENSVAVPAGGAATDDDEVVREERLENQAQVRYDTNPSGSNIGVFDTRYPLANFADSLHPDAGGNRMWTMRFRSDGTVVNAGNDANATGAAVTSATLFIWQPQTPTSLSTYERRTVRAITVNGATGSVRLWKYNGTTFEGR